MTGTLWEEVFLRRSKKRNLYETLCMAGQDTARLYILLNAEISFRSAKKGDIIRHSDVST